MRRVRVMEHRILVGVGLAMALLSSPVSLARYSVDISATTQPGGSQVVTAQYRGEANSHMLELVSVLARPEPVLAPGATIVAPDGAFVGQVEDVVVHQSIIQAVISLQSAQRTDELLLVPATAFETTSGEVVLAIPLDQLNQMQRLSP